MRHVATFFATFVAWAILALAVSILTGCVTLFAYHVTSSTAVRLIGSDAHNVSGAIGILAFVLCCIGIVFAMLTVRAELQQIEAKATNRRTQERPQDRGPLPGSTRPRS